jgi:extracellular factor (EF) 3-hydroxypalmitic acid methyl ester biosynthesis protein
MNSISGVQHEKTRKHDRRPYSQTIHYSLGISESNRRKWLDLKGKAIDISDTGIGIQTDYPLAPGHMLWFSSGTEEKAGFVRWCTKTADDEYRVGVELDGKQIRTLDEATEIFNRRLEEMEQRCLDPDASSEAMLKQTRNAIDVLCESCRSFESDVKDKDIIHDAQVRFRIKTNPILSKSHCIHRVRTWPQGYQGDYKTLEAIYRNTPLSDGIGYYLDLCSLNFPLGVAVRNRIEKLEGILREELQSRTAPSVLNIACGSCREVFELTTEIEQSGAKFTCIDLDNDALAFAANRLSYTNISPVTSDQVILRKYNAVRMFDHEMNMNEFGMQDIIYSVGLFDYLPTDFLINLLGALYKMIKSGGKLIASFKDAARYRSQEYHWIFDWDGFLQRKEEDFRNILFDAGIPSSAITETREDSGVIIFYLIEK